MPLALPPHVEAREINAVLEAQAELDIAEARHWTEELKRIDPALSVVWVNEGVDDPELVPACWHVRKEIPGSVDAYIPLEVDGERRPPGGWLLDWLTANDLWNPRVHRDREEAKAKVRQAKVRRKALEEEQRRDEMAVAYRAAKRIRGDSGMTKRTDLKGKPTENSV